MRPIHAQPRARPRASHETDRSFDGGFLGVHVVEKSLLGPSSQTLDQSSRGLALDIQVIKHSFTVILANAHFSLPLGLLFYYFAWYIRGELTGSARCYDVEAAIAVLEAVSRPDDRIAH